MSYNPYYLGGWQSGEVGGTPITPEALNNMEDGITEAQETADNATTSAENAQNTADAALPKTGGTMEGAINMGSNKITNLATPTDDADAATRKYVLDTAFRYKSNLNGDIDVRTLIGVYWIETSKCTGTFPEDWGNYGYLDSTNYYQRLIQYSSNGVTKIYERYYTNNKWYPWIRVDSLNKQDAITGAITTVLTDNFVPDKALISNSDGKLAISAVTSTELGYLDGVTSNVQAQLDGKAPSGYGLGASGVFNSSVDSVFKGGFYRWDSDNDQTPFGYATMLVVPRASTSAAQIAICNASTPGVMAFRTTTSETPGSWKFLNPYMTPGNEYLTPEFWNQGKPVYKKLVKMGKLTTEFVEVAHGASLYYVVGVEAMAINETTKVSFPIAYAANDNVDDIGVYVDTTNVTIHNPQLLSAYSGYVIIKYVK